MTRTERQYVSYSKWVKAGGKATIVGCTGYGKTKVAINTIEKLKEINDHIFALIIVPTEVLQEQWTNQLIERNLIDNCQVEIINSAIKKEWECDFLIIDEVHIAASETFQRIFKCVNYKLIMCLTATLERLDGKEYIIKRFAPVCDTITIKDAEENKWVSPHKEYLVLLDVDLDDYINWTKEFNSCFAQFGFDFKLAMDCATQVTTAQAYAKTLGVNYKTVMGVAKKWNTCMRKRKEFIYNHPKKIEIARKIIAARQNSKGITFSSTIKQAESFGFGLVMHSKKKKKENKQIIEQFNQMESGYLHTSKKADQGLDCQGVNLEIILHTDSSKTRKIQRVGRAIRFEPDKTAEIFTIVLRGTQEVNWFKNSSTSKYIVINEKQLDRVLRGESLETRERESVATYKYRY